MGALHDIVQSAGVNYIMYGSGPQILGTSLSNEINVDQLFSVGGQAGPQIHTIINTR